MLNDGSASWGSTGSFVTTEDLIPYLQQLSFYYDIIHSTTSLRHSSQLFLYVYLTDTQL